MKRGRVMLVDKLGFSYNINSRRPYVKYWQCTAQSLQGLSNGAGRDTSSLLFLPLPPTKTASSIVWDITVMFVLLVIAFILLGGFLKEPFVCKWLYTCAQFSLGLLKSEKTMKPLCESSFQT